MNNESKNYHAEPWKEFAVRWRDLYTAPGRPSLPDIRVYRAFVEDATRDTDGAPRVLVLGATPELRNFLHEMNCEVTIVDVNMEMILAMTELIKDKNAKEMVLRADWGEMPLSDNYFDVVIGDLVIPNVLPEKRDAFVKRVHSVLKPGGAFVTRVFLPLDVGTEEAGEQVLVRYANIPKAETRSHEMFADLFRNIALDTETMMYDISRVRDFIATYKVEEGVYKHDNENITNYLNKMWNMWKPMDKRWSVQTETGYEAMLGAHFDIHDKKVAGVCFYEHMNETFPLWYMRKKNGQEPLFSL